MLLKEIQYSTLEVFCGTIHSIFFFGAKWMEKIPCVIFQFYEKMQACQSSFLDKIQQFEVPVTSYNVLCVDPKLDVYYLQHTLQHMIKAYRYLDLDKGHFTKF
uniref:Uncharacterized protein n=1 Tax=Acrobeloides nanus TaxID=290746 RepID=A0A914E023_9BILA